jgi:transcriptional regulator with XRE-family HTH domain
MQPDGQKNTAAVSRIPSPPPSPPRPGRGLGEVSISVCFIILHSSFFLHRAMSYLSIALQRRAEQRRLNQSDLAKQSGISRSYISRLYSGEFSELSDANFTSLLKVFAAEPQAQAELVAARCMDARVGPGSELVEISVKGHTPAKEAKQPEFPDVELSRETERAFAWLRSQCPLNPELEKHLVGYARMLGMK